MKITILTPSYNQARFCREAIESVQSQRGDFELEHIVIDGVSTDGTLDIVRSFGDRIVLLSEPDEGQADALNKGLALATGDVIGWLNTDDRFEPGALESVARVFQSEPLTQWLYGKVHIIDANGQRIRRPITAYKNFKMRRFSYDSLLTENWISQMGVFWRRAAGERVGGFRKDLNWSMDYDYWLRLGQHWPARLVPEYLASYRWYLESKCGADFVSQLREELDVAKLHAGGRALPIWSHEWKRMRTSALYWLLSLRERRGEAGAVPPADA